MGYWEEKANFEKQKAKLEKQKPMQNSNNKCPKCEKGIMVVTIDDKLSKWTPKKVGNVFTSFCPVCGYTIKKEVEL